MVQVDGLLCQHDVPVLVVAKLEVVTSYLNLTAGLDILESSLVPRPRTSQQAAGWADDKQQTQQVVLVQQTLNLKHPPGVESLNSVIENYNFLCPECAPYFVGVL